MTTLKKVIHGTRFNSVTASVKLFGLRDMFFLFKFRRVQVPGLLNQGLSMSTFVRTREMVVNYAREGRSQGNLRNLNKKTYRAGQIASPKLLLK